MGKSWRETLTQIEDGTLGEITEDMKAPLMDGTITLEEVAHTPSTARSILRNYADWLTTWRALRVQGTSWREFTDAIIAFERPMRFFLYERTMIRTFWPWVSAYCQAGRSQPGPVELPQEMLDRLRLMSDLVQVAHGADRADLQPMLWTVPDDLLRILSVHPRNRPLVLPRPLLQGLVSLLISARSAPEQAGSSSQAIQDRIDQIIQILGKCRWEQVLNACTTEELAKISPEDVLAVEKEQPAPDNRLSKEAVQRLKVLAKEGPASKQFRSIFWSIQVSYLAGIGELMDCDDLSASQVAKLSIGDQFEFLHTSCIRKCSFKNKMALFAILVPFVVVLLIPSALFYLFLGIPTAIRENMGDRRGLWTHLKERWHQYYPLRLIFRPITLWFPKKD